MTTSPRDEEIQVLVVGAGIGGLALARLLGRAGLEPVVVERAETLERPDGPVELPPGAVTRLTRLGIDVGDLGSRVTTWSLRRPDGTVLARYDPDADAGLVATRYALLRDRLREAVTGGVVRTGTALRSLDADGDSVAVEFETGVRERFDVVVGADGARSRTRELLGGAPPDAYGTASWAFALDAAPGLDGASEVWTDDGAVVRVLPAGDRPMGWLTLPTEAPGRAAADPGGLDDGFPEVDWPFPGGLDGVSPADVWSAADLRVASDVRADGRVALVGDAAHARHRVAGVGPTLAIADATALGSELLERDDGLAARLADYAARARSRVRRVVGPAESSHPLAGVESPLADRHPAIPGTRGRHLRSCFETPADSAGATGPDR